MPEEIKAKETEQTVETPDEEREPDYDGEASFDPAEADEEWDNVKWGNDDEDGNGGEEESEDGESDKADQPEAEDAVEKPAEPEEKKPEAADQDADQWLELKHMDDPIRKVSKAEAKELAQKGLDYDRVRQERDELKSNNSRYVEMENFLKEMQGDFASIEDFMDDTRARIKAESEGISFEDAMKSVKAARAPKSEPKPAEPKASPVDEFVRRYPNVKADEIPASVWAEVKQTGDLVGAYEKYRVTKENDRIKALEEEIATLKNNNKNAARSTGSSKSSGNNKAKSLIATLWEEDDD